MIRTEANRETRYNNVRRYWQIIEVETVMAEAVRVLLNAENGAGFRNWMHDTFESGYVPKREHITAGDIAAAMLRQRLDYFNNLFKTKG